MYSSPLVTVILCLFVAFVNGAVTLNGDCPNWKPQQNLQSSRLSGDWIGLWGLKHGLERPQASCVRTNDQVSVDGIINTTLHFKPVRANRNMTKYLIGTPIDGQLGKLAYQNIHNTQTKICTILETDYDNYLVITNCHSSGGKHGYSVVIMSRQQHLSPQLLENARQAISAANINLQNLVAISQDNCNN